MRKHPSTIQPMEEPKSGKARQSALACLVNDRHGASRTAMSPPHQLANQQPNEREGSGGERRAHLLHLSPFVRRLFDGKYGGYATVSYDRPSGSFQDNTLGHCRSGRLTSRPGSHFQSPIRGTLQNCPTQHRQRYLVPRSANSQSNRGVRIGPSLIARLYRAAFLFGHAFGGDSPAYQHSGNHNSWTCLSVDRRRLRRARSRKRTWPSTLPARAGYFRTFEARSNHRKSCRSCLLGGGL